MATESGEGPRATDMESGVPTFSSSESTPLLSASPSTISLEISKHDTTEPFIRVAQQEVNWIVSSSSLVILTFILQASFSIANVISVSHLGPHSLAAMSLATTCTGLIALAPVSGLLSAMDTFCSTAFTASRDKIMVGFHLQRGLIAVMNHLVLAAIILWNGERILLAVGQDPEIARLSGMFLRVHILSLLPYAVFEATKRYLQAQGIMRAGTTVIIFVAPIHWACSYFFVRSSYGIGFVGASIANTIGYWLLLIGMLIYARNSRASETWGGWDFSALRNMSAYYRLAIPAVITVCAEWIGFELLTLGVSYFGAHQMAANAIVASSGGITYHLNNGLGYGTSPRIGNLIGAAKPRQARIALTMALVASSCIGVIGTTFFMLFGNWWISIYTDNPKVAEITTGLLPIACVFLIGDGYNAVLGSVMRGLGRQKVSAKIFMFCFYFCAVPIALYLGYGLNMQAVGLWWGLCIGILMACLFQFAYIINYVDWNDEVRRCMERLRQNSRQQATERQDNPSSST